MSKHLIIPDEVIVNKIYYFRGEKVMIDRDLAELYGVKTKVLKQAVNRNMDIFPKQFMFEMTSSELKLWRSQIVTSKSDRKGLRYLPYCFTEHGVLMLANVLKSQSARKMCVRIIEVFVKMSKMLEKNKDILVKLEELERKIAKQDERHSKHEDEIQTLFIAIRNLIEDKKQKVKPRKPMGFKINNKK